MDIVERMRKPLLCEETLEKVLDPIAKLYRAGDTGSLPRDIFESFIDDLDCERAEAAALIASQARRIEELEKGVEAGQLRETGWVIERGNSQPSAPTYWAGPDRWSQDHMDAVRFSRQIDAARVASRETWLAPHQVCEHVWISARSLLNRTGEG